MKQLPLYNNTKGEIYIPIDRAVLFRAKYNKNSPEGKSILRNAYRSWFFLKRVQEIEAIAIERELNGLPVCYLPADLLSSSASADVATVNLYKKLVKDVRLNNQSGVLLPSNPYVDNMGNPTNVPMVKFELVSTNGRRSIDTNAVKNDYKMDIARTVLADFIMLGMNERGSYALSSDKTTMFLDAIKGWLNNISSTINNEIIPKLWKLNNLPMDNIPYIRGGDLQPEDIEALSNYIQKLAAAGMPLFPDEDLEERLRDAADLPAKNMDNQDSILAGMTEEELNNKLKEMANNIQIDTIPNSPNDNIPNNSMTGN